MSPQSAQEKAKLLRKLINGLFAEWPRVSAELCGEPLENETAKDCEKRLRIEWTNQQLGVRYQVSGVSKNRERAPIASWNDLSIAELRFLQRQMWEQTGNAAAWRGKKIRELAQALCGDGAAAYLAKRMFDRFSLAPNPESLTPAQFRALREEIQSQIARKEIVAAGDKVNDATMEHKLEEVRERFSPQRHGGAEKG